MKIVTNNSGTKDVRVIKYFEVNGRKFAVHRFLTCFGEFSDAFTASDYLTGYEVPRCYSYYTKRTIKLATEVLNSPKALKFNFNKYETINK